MVTQGDVVQVHYTGTFADGTVFDSSRGQQPLGFTVGRGQVIPGFDRAVIGLEVGSAVRVTIPPAEGYGEYSNNYVIRAKRSDIPPDITPELGMELTLHQDDGGQIPVRITDVSATHVTLDANHPLAGKELIFDIEVVSVKSK